MKRLARFFRRLARLRDDVGARGERIAAKHLREAGYTILACNYRTRMGEIDIIATAPDGRTIVIVEVKASAAADDAFTPEMHVTRRKQRKLFTLATQYARRCRLTDRPFRFDVIGIENVNQTAPTIRHHQGAFQSHV